MIPVIIRNADWTQAKFAKLQALPKEGKAVTLWPDRDSARRRGDPGGGRGDPFKAFRRVRELTAVNGAKHNN